MFVCPSYVTMYLSITSYTGASKLPAGYTEYFISRPKALIPA